MGLHQVVAPLLVVLAVPVVHGRGKCTPETRCTNSPDEGLSSTSEFLPPTGASPSELAAYKAGMNYSIPGTEQCLYGHVDLEGSSMTLEDTRTCPLKDGGMCGLVIDYYVCTCASRERALASHDSRPSWAGFGVLLGFGLFMGLYFLFQCCKNLSSSLWSGDGYCGPGCDCSEQGIFWFWFVVFIAFCLPAGLIAGAIYNLLEALKSPEEAVGYWGGCGKKHFFNLVNPGGIVLYSIIGGSFALMICFSCFALWSSKHQRKRHPALAAHQIASARLPGRPVASTTSGSSSASASSGARATHDDSVTSGGRPMYGRGTRDERLTHLKMDLAELTHPVGLARAVSQGRLEGIGVHGPQRGRSGRITLDLLTKARADPATGVPVVMAAAISHSGWMKKVVPSSIGATKDRYFVLYSSGLFQYYDSEKFEPDNLMGKMDLTKDVKSVERRSRRQTTILHLKSKTRMVSWELDAGTDENAQEWEDQLRPFVEPVVVEAVEAVAAVV